MKRFNQIIIIVFLCSCQPVKKEIQVALERSGNNRIELEKVLNHYSGRDKKKYEAACFLIANMPYHESEQHIQLGDEYFNHFQQTDSIFESRFGGLSTEEIKLSSNDSLWTDFSKVFDSIPPPIYSEGSNDCKTITASFLINNIDEAFKSWETNPLLKNMDFDLFKELILPYRSAKEGIMNRTVLRQMFERQISKDGFQPIHCPVERYKTYINKCLWINSQTKRKDKIGVYELIAKSYELDCFDIATWTCNVFRACGIPIAFEYTPQWKDSDNMHYWCASPDSTGKMKPFTPPNNNLGEDWEYYLKPAGKIYRKTYGINKSAPYFLCQSDEYIPDNLSSPLILDVTGLYHPTTTVRLPFTKETNNNLAYLCLYNSMKGTNPVAWGVIDKKKKKVIFEQVPVNTLFFPMYLDENKNETFFGDPFLFSFEKGIIYLPFHCNKDSLINMHLLRIFPDKRNLQHVRLKFCGAHIEAGNDLNGPLDTLFIFEKTPLLPYLQDILLQNHKKYRYYRIKASGTNSLSIAHIEFVDNNNSSTNNNRSTPLPVFYESPDQPEGNFYKIFGKFVENKNTEKAMFDNDIETFAKTQTLTMDFGFPVCIDRIRMAPQNENNIIVSDNSYQLFFHNHGKWENAGIKTARKNYLLFENVPSGTIYLLKNLNDEKSSLPFFYINGKQEWE